LEDINIVGRTLISGFRRDVDEICGLLAYYTASCGNYLPTFRDNVSVPPSRVNNRVITQKTTDFNSTNVSVRLHRHNSRVETMQDHSGEAKQGTSTKTKTVRLLRGAQERA
jgi:hypothetical protein